MFSNAIFTLLLIFFSPASDVDKETMVSMVNNVRKTGCTCGRTKMPPVKEVKWNDKLYSSASSHAQDMRRYKYFSHFSKRGEDVGERVDKFNYNWLVIGENIAEGQATFNQALEDWLKSPSHCKMIMDPKVNEMAVAKSGKYWVQHFGKEKSNAQ